MLEFTKSTMSTGLALSLFGMQQIMNVFRGPRPGAGRPVSESLDSVAQSVVDQCGDSLRETFHTTDKIQRGMVDLTFRILSLNGARSPNGSATTGAAQQAADLFRRWVGGAPGGDCGCGSGESSATGGDSSWRSPPVPNPEDDGSSSTGWRQVPPVA